MHTNVDTRSLKTAETHLKKVETQANHTQKALGKPPPGSSGAWVSDLTKKYQTVADAAANAGKIIGVGFGLNVAAGVALASVALVKFVKDTIAINSQMEQFQTSLRTTLGSLAAAKTEMAAIVEFARVTPYEIAGVTEAFVKLRAYALDPDFWATAAGDMSAAFGKPMTKAVEAIADATRGEFKRMREFGFVFHVNDFKAGGKHAGETYADAIFKAITGRFKGGMALQAQTYAGIVSNLKDTITIGVAAAGQPIFAMVKKSASNLLAYFDTLKSSGKLDEYVAKFQRAFQKFQEAMAKAKDYVMSNWMPAIKETIKNGYDLAKSLAKAFGPDVIKSLDFIVTSIIQMVNWITRAMVAGRLLIEIYLKFKIASLIFGLLGLNIKSATVAMAGFGTSSATAGAAASAAATKFTVMLAAMALLAMYNSGKELESNINTVVKNTEGKFKADEIKKNAEEIGNAMGYSINEVAAAMSAASEYGDKWKEITTTATKSARAFGMGLTDTVKMLGEFGKAFDIPKNGYDKLADSIYNVTQAGKKYKFDSDAILDTLKDFPDVLYNSAQGYEYMMKMAVAFGKKGKEGIADLKKFMIESQLLMTPSKEMLIGGKPDINGRVDTPKVDPNTWVSRSIREAKDKNEVAATMFNASADGVTRLNDQAKQLETTLKDLSKDETLAGLNIAGIIGADVGLVKIPQVIEVLQKLDAEETRLTLNGQRLQNAIADQTSKLTELQLADWDVTHAAQVTALALLTENNAVNKLNPSIGDLSLAMKKLDLKSLQIDLQIANSDFREQENVIKSLTNASKEQAKTIKDMTDALKPQEQAIKKMTDAVKEEEKAISALNKGIKNQEAALQPLKDELKGLEDQFTSISDSISKAQEDLDKFTNPKLEGMGAFDDQIHDIDMQLNLLERQRLDAASGLGIWERLGLTDTDAYKRASQGLESIDKQIASLNNNKDKLELDRSIAFDDQLYQLGKIGDSQKEITFEDAVKGATDAKEQIIILGDKLKAVGSDKDKLTEEIKLRQDGIDLQQKMVDKRQDELEIQNEIIAGKQDELEAARDIISSKQDELNLANDIIATKQDELDASKDILQSAKDEIDAQKNKLSILQQIKQTQQDIAGDIPRREAEVASATRALAISEISHSLELNQTALDVNTTQLEKVKEAEKTLVTAIESLIESINTPNISDAPAVGKGGAAVPKTGAGAVEKMDNWVSNFITKNKMAAVGIALGGAAVVGGTPWVKGVGHEAWQSASERGGKAAVDIGKSAVDPNYVKNLKDLPIQFRGALDDISKNLNLVANAPNKGLATIQTNKFNKSVDTLADSLKTSGVYSPRQVDALVNRAKNSVGVVNAAREAKNPAARGMLAGYQQNQLDKAVKKAEVAIGHLGTATERTVTKIGVPSRMERAGGWISDHIGKPGRRIAEGVMQNAGFSNEVQKAQEVVRTAVQSGDKTAVKAAKAALKELIGDEALPRKIAANLEASPGVLKRMVGRGLGAASTPSSIDTILHTATTGKGVKAADYAALKVSNEMNAWKDLNPEKILGRKEATIWGKFSSRARNALDIRGKGKLGSPGEVMLGDLVPDIGKIGPKIAKVGKAIPKLLANAAKSTVKFGAGSVLDVVLGSYDLQKVIRKIPGWDTFFSSDKNPLVKGMDVLFSVFGDKFGNIFLKITDPIAAGAKALEQIILAVEKFIEVGLSFVGGVAISIYNFFDSLFTWDWDGFGSKISGAFTGVWDNIEGVWEHLKEFWTYFQEEFAGLWELIKAPFVDAWTWIDSDEGPKGWPGKVWDILVGIGSWIGERASEAAAWFSQIFTKALEWIVGENGPKSWPGKIWDILVSIGGWIGERLSDAIGWFSQIFTSAWEWIKTEVPTWPGKIWGYIADLGRLIREKVSDVTGWFSNLFSGAWGWLSGPEGPAGWASKIAGWIAELPGKISGIAQDLINAGKDIMSNLWEGMQQKVKEIPGLGFVIGKAIDAVGAVESYAGGGIARGPASGYSATLHGVEAVIPLQSGYVPVKITGDSKGGDIYNTNVATGAFNIVVRDDADMEEVKKILISLQKNTFKDSPYNYPQGY